VLDGDVVKTKILNLKAKASALKAKAWTFEAKAIGPEAKAFKHTNIAEIKIEYAVGLRLTVSQDR